MRRAAHPGSTLIALLIWCTMSGIWPLIALHVTLEHDHHATPASHHHEHEGAEDPSTDHDSSNHDHPKIDANTTHAAIRLGGVTPITIAAAAPWSGSSILQRPVASQHIDPTARSSPVLLRSCILLL